jgi:hypothetical protein
MFDLSVTGSSIAILQRRNDPLGFLDKDLERGRDEH